MRWDEKSLTKLATVTERARKLRAQYMLQAQGLRTRIEIRVNRIPTALRQAKMGDLLRKYGDVSAPNNPGPTNLRNRLPHINVLAAPKNLKAGPLPKRGMKRTSHVLSPDKENEDLDNPKKRNRASPLPSARIISNLPPSQILSPRSTNSQTLPYSPMRLNLRKIPTPSQPTSPVKPSLKHSSTGSSKRLRSIVSRVDASRGAASTIKPKTGPTRAAARGQKAATPSTTQAKARARASTTSQSSNSSSSTVVKKTSQGTKNQVKVGATSKKKGVLGAIKNMGSQKKSPLTKGGTSSTSTGIGRVLRKRK